MSKSKHRQQPIPNRQNAAPPPQQGSIAVQLGYDPNGPAEPVDVVSSKEGWSEYTLTDGTVIRAKAVILDVKKLTNQYAADGEPIYMLQLTFINQTKAPDHLKKKKG
jgi:hypothetical protein